MFSPITPIPIQTDNSLFFTFLFSHIFMGENYILKLPQIGETDSFVVDLELPFLLLYQDFVSPESVLVITGET